MAHTFVSEVSQHSWLIWPTVWRACNPILKMEMGEGDYAPHLILNPPSLKWGNPEMQCKIQKKVCSLYQTVISRLLSRCLKVGSCSIDEVKKKPRSNSIAIGCIADCLLWLAILNVTISDTDMKLPMYIREIFISVLAKFAYRRSKL